LIVFQNRGLKAQKFRYDHANLEFFNWFTRKGIALTGWKETADVFKDGHNVISEKFESDNAEKWSIQYC